MRASWFWVHGLGSCGAGLSQSVLCRSPQTTIPYTGRQTHTLYSRAAYYLPVIRALWYSRLSLFAVATRRLRAEQ